eukprot:SAG11_NODE_371_length_10051_cov_5.987741_4_plen_124_part_00
MRKILFGMHLTIEFSRFVGYFHIFPSHTAREMTNFWLRNVNPFYQQMLKHVFGHFTLKVGKTKTRTFDEFGYLDRLGLPTGYNLTKQKHAIWKSSMDVGNREDRGSGIFPTDFIRARATLILA